MPGHHTIVIISITLLTMVAILFSLDTVREAELFWHRKRKYQSDFRQQWPDQVDLVFTQRGFLPESACGWHIRNYHL